MKEVEKRMKAQTTIFGRIVKCYNLPMESIDDLNYHYEKEKNKLISFGHRLAGRLDSELEVTNILQKTKISKHIVDCMHDYIDTLEKVNLLKKKPSLKILNAWINDMQEGEYNPPHTHHNGKGWSTVLFLKVPEYINDTKDPHKFKDGQLGFIANEGSGTTWMEPKKGQFYIFEAIHQHFVMPFKVKNKGNIRRSMSFNFIDNEKIINDK
tara:strand:+ start:59 stop:688 length:630 start_codon:yes stop_codon:yes gene_type:complete